jgi:hypothetical protein
VFVDRASPTAQGDGVVRSAGRGWRRLTRAHTYRWHEHRLHALEVVGGGDWAVPLRVDGERTALRGTLRRLHGEPRWPWLAVGVVILAALASVQALRTAGLLGGAAAAAVRIGHAVHVAAVFDAVATAVLAVSLLALLARARTADGRATAALVVGVGAVGEAIVMTPVLTHAAALNALPTALARAFVVSAYAAGAVAVAASFRTLIREESS